MYAHLNNLPAGKYRVRIKADTDCLVDEIDIRPAMDVGIGIVENTYPIGHYDHLYNHVYSAFLIIQKMFPRELLLNLLREFRVKVPSS